MSTPQEAVAVSVLLSLSGDASNEKKPQYIKLEDSRVLRLDWNTMTFQELDANVLVTVPIKQSDKRQKAANAHLLPPFILYLQIKQLTQTLSAWMNISAEKMLEISSVFPDFHPCSCGQGKHNTCRYGKMLKCRFCPVTKLFVNGKRVTNYGENPIACGTPGDVKRNFKAHVEPTQRNNHDFWCAVHELSELSEEEKSKKKRNHHDKWIQMLKDKQHLWEKMKHAFRKANLLDSDEAEQWGNNEKFSRADTLFEFFGINTHETKPRKRSRRALESEDEGEQSEEEEEQSEEDEEE